MGMGCKGREKKEGEQTVLTTSARRGSRVAKVGKNTAINGKKSALQERWNGGGGVC